LHTYVLSWSGDTPGLTKLMNTTGHNSYKGCRFCNIRSIYSRHIYFPTTPPIGKEECEVYDPQNLPLRTHNQFRDNIHQLNRANTLREKEKLEAEFGNFRSIKSIHTFIY
jgi:hypothetical protein